MKRRLLVDDWRRAHKWVSVRMAALLAMLSLFAASLPELETVLPGKTYHWAVFGFAIAIGLGRLIFQKGDDPPETPRRRASDNPAGSADNGK